MATKVVIIAGAGRSGSTFLSQLLSQNPDSFNVGQIRHFPVSFSKDRPCSCGQSLTSCPYWSQIEARLVAKHGNRAIGELKRGFAAFQEFSNEHDNWQDPAVRDLIQQRNPRFLELMADLYTISADEAGGKALIDSSKQPNVCLALLLAKDIDLYTLNLIRDPRAVLCSWAKLVEDDQKLKGRTRNWNGRVEQMKKIKSIPGVNFLQLRYEDFTASPRQQIEQIQKWAGMQVATPYFLNDTSADITWDRTHLFPPANEEVLERKATHIDIKPSESWKSPANKKYRDMAEAASFPLAREFGYELFA